MKTVEKVFIMIRMNCTFFTIVSPIFGFMALSYPKKAKTATEFPMWLKSLCFDWWHHPAGHEG